MFKALFRKDPANAAGERLYAAAAEQARAEPFYAAMGAPDTVEGRFEMTALHVWLVLRRLKGDEAARRVGQRLFDAMFSSFDAALRELGVGDLVVGKKIRKLAENFYGRAAAYDAALAGDDEALAAALARNVYGDANPAKAATLAAYVRRAAEKLDGQDRERIVGGVVDFPAPEPA